MKKIFVALLLLAASKIPAQTKRIAFESHSGNMENFSNALEDGLSDADGSNFGMAPTRTVKNAQLDSLIFISDSVAIMVTHEYCTTSDIYDPKTISKSMLWKAGRDMVYKHPLFSRQHSLDSIKKMIRTQYYFQNPVEKIVFVGYDNDKVREREEQMQQQIEYYSVPAVAINGDNDQTPFGPPFILIAGLIVGLSLLGALLSWRYMRWKEIRFASCK